MNFYRDILKRAWSITWRNKYFWFFGLFAVLLGSGGEYDFLIHYAGSRNGEGLFPALGDLATTGIFSWQTIPDIGRAILNDPITSFILILILLIILVLVGFLLWLMIVSQVAILNNSAKLIGGKDAGFREGVEVGIKKFWPVLSMNIIMKVIGYAFVIFLSITLFSDNTALSITHKILFIIFLVLSLFFSFIMRYSMAYLVIKEKGFKDSIVDGWNLFRNNKMISLEMAIIIFCLSVVAVFLVAVMILTISTPFMFLAYLFVKLQSPVGLWLVLIVGFLLLIIILFLAGAIIASFQISAWTSLYLELVSSGGKSKLVRIFSKTA